MARGGTKQPLTRISGQTIVDELIRNMELGRLEMAYSVLLPCVFSVYLHPEDYQRLASVQDFIKEDARRALAARISAWNNANSLFRRGSAHKPHRIAQNDWWIELFSDSEGSVPQGDVEIHSELSDVPQPGYGGAKTTLIDREPSVTARRTKCSPRSATATIPDRRSSSSRRTKSASAAAARISGSICRSTRAMKCPASTCVCSATRPAESSQFRTKAATALGSMARRLTQGVEETLPERAEIGVAEVLKLSFEARK
jgi:hypothetical protein